MPLEVKAFFNLIIIKMPITAYSMESEVFFGSCNIKFIYFVIPESREVPIGAQMPQGPAADVSVHASLEFYFLSSERTSPSGLCPELGLKDFFIEKPLVPISQIQYLFF